MMIIGGAALLALILLIVIIVIVATHGKKADKPAAVVETPAPTVEAEMTPVPTAQPTQQPVSATNLGANAQFIPAAPDGWLPVFTSSATTENIMAITIDDCFQAENLRQIVQCAIDNGAKLTIFPIGENAIKSSIAPILKYAWENGMELENHTFTHNGLFSCDDAELAWEVSMQSNAIDYVLGLDYTEHFLRPRGGDARHDQRMHEYARQFGLYGIAHWNQSGGGQGKASLASSMAPGNIYLFHTTDKDLDKLLGFIPYAVSQGYRLVTLNEMFGLPENETKPLTCEAVDQPVVELQPFKWIPVEYKKGQFAYGIARIQQILIADGYLKGTADGDYGDMTKNAVAAWQGAHGLSPTGVADIETQTKMGLYD